MPGASYSVFDHTADIGIEVVAPSREELYATAATALFDILADISRVGPGTVQEVTVTGEDAADLLVRWLSELLYLHDVEGWLYREFRIDEVTEHRLSARVYGERYDPDRHTIKTEIKAVTYHQVFAGRIERGWMARLVLDV